MQVSLRWVKQFPREVSCSVGSYGNYSGSFRLGLVLLPVRLVKSQDMSTLVVKKKELGETRSAQPHVMRGLCTRAS